MPPRLTSGRRRAPAPEALRDLHSEVRLRKWLSAAEQWWREGAYRKAKRAYYQAHQALTAIRDAPWLHEAFGDLPHWVSEAERLEKARVETERYRHEAKALEEQGRLAEAFQKVEAGLHLSPLDAELLALHVRLAPNVNQQETLAHLAQLLSDEEYALAIRFCQQELEARPDATWAAEGVASKRAACGRLRSRLTCSKLSTSRTISKRTASFASPTRMV